MHKWFSAQELTGLPGMPGTERAIQLRAKREGWEGQRRLGSKAIEYNFAVLPPETQAALLARLVQQVEPQPVPAPTTSHALISPQRDAISASRFSDEQRAVMTARVAVIRAIERMSKAVSRQRAILTLVELARAGQLSPYLAAHVERANDRKTDDRTLSERTLKRWLADYRKHGEVALAPARRKPDMSVPSWAPMFLKHYQRPQKPSVAAAYEKFRAEYPGAPSIHAVNRFLAKLSPQAREMGRMGPREAKSLEAFNRRVTDGMWPNDVWVADGHKFDAEVIDSRTGKPFRPEVTTIIDWATRRIVGFAINLAESTVSTLDALRDGLCRAGMFRIFYVDNGSGFANDKVREVVDRLGGEMTHSLPYNSQARGVIERSHRTILVRLAKDFDSYIGADMDAEAKNKVHRISRADLKKGATPRYIPTLQEFYDRLSAAVDEYNHRSHRGLPKIRDIETGKRRHQSPMEAWKSAEAEGFAVMPATLELSALLTRPQNVRRTHRGEVRINGGTYYLQDLVPLHSEQVRVAWDYRDASSVAVFSLDGDLLGEAKLGGNASHAMPRLQKNADRRVKGQVARLEQKGETLIGQKVEMRVIPSAQPATELTPEQRALAAARVAQLTAERTPALQLPTDPLGRYRAWLALDARLISGEALSEAEAKWHADYPKHPDFISTRRVLEHFDKQRTATA